MADSVTWDTIKTYFRQVDIDHMLDVSGGDIDLSNCGSVSSNAKLIYSYVSKHKMPPDQPWSAERIANFKAWMDAGAKCS